MASQLSSIAAILLSTAFLLAGNGLTNTLTPVRAHLEGFPDLAIGAIGSFYYAGFVVGCLAMPKLIARAGHIRTFAVAGSLTTAVVLLQPIFVSPATWIALRMAFGVCAAGVYTVIESWLNERATNETRGRILSAYVFVNFGALMLGQWILTAASPKGFELFSLAAILCAVGTVPVAVTRLPQPAPSAVPGFRILELAENAPVGIAGVVAAGLANAAVWVLAPVYALSLGFSTTGVALFMCAFTLGGALIQLPLGRFSDRCDRRWIIAGMSAAAAIGGIALAIFSSHARGAPWALYALAFFFGAAILPLYSLSIAHANDRIERTKFVQASATLLMINALAAVAGPSIAAVVTLYAGRSSLFLYTAAIHVAISGFAIWRSSAKRAVGADQREQFVAVPQPSSPNSFELDPRAP